MVNEYEVLNDLEPIRKYSYFNEWYDLVKVILLNEEFRRRKYFKHHDCSVWDHSIDVSFKSFLVAKFYNLDIKCAAVAGLLHDFYPYAWQYSKELEDIDGNYLQRYYKRHKPIYEWHGLCHAKEAATNALKYFPELVTPQVYNAIKCHMFPLNPIPPKYIEGWIITSMDKRTSINILANVKELPNYVGLRTH